MNGQPAYRIRWDDVAYEPGELKVVAYKNGKEWATDTVKTAGEASRLVLKPDRSTIAGDGHDISFVTLTVVDQAGVMVPRAKNLIHFSITGPGEIVATDNGDATDLASFQDSGPQSVQRPGFGHREGQTRPARRDHRDGDIATGWNAAKTTIKLK